MSDEDTQEPPRRGRGRPKKGEIVAKKKGSRGVRGRPKGDAAIINEYKARMLASPKSAKVLETIFEAALDHDHKNPETNPANHARIFCDMDEALW